MKTRIGKIVGQAHRLPTSNRQPKRSPYKAMKLGLRQRRRLSSLSHYDKDNDKSDQKWHSQNGDNDRNDN
jgi:hypothetical protein